MHKRQRELLPTHDRYVVVFLISFRPHIIAVWRCRTIIVEGFVKAKPKLFLERESPKGSMILHDFVSSLHYNLPLPDLSEQHWR
jgi:hypothetical protein